MHGWSSMAVRAALHMHFFFHSHAHVPLCTGMHAADPGCLTFEPSLVRVVWICCTLSLPAVTSRGGSDRPAFCGIRKQQVSA